MRLRRRETNALTLTSEETEHPDGWDGVPTVHDPHLVIHASRADELSQVA